MEYLHVAFSLVVAPIGVEVVPDGSAPDGEPLDKLGAVVSALLTVTLTVDEVVVFPAASLAVAVMECDPFPVVVEFHDMLYGLVVSSVPKFTPSSLNCTPTTPTLSVAVADTVTAVPDTVAPLAGAEIETAGAVVSLPPVVENV